METNMSVSLITLIGTLAGVVGTILTVLRLLQDRHRPAQQPEAPSPTIWTFFFGSSPNMLASPNDRKKKRRSAQRAMRTEENSRMLTASLWVALVLLVAWLFAAIFNIREGTIPILLIMAPPGVLAVYLAVPGARESCGAVVDYEVIYYRLGYGFADYRHTCRRSNGQD